MAEAKARKQKRLRMRLDQVRRRAALRRAAPRCAVLRFPALWRAVLCVKEVCGAGLQLPMSLLRPVPMRRSPLTSPPPPLLASHPPPPQARQKAEAVANQEDVPLKQKMREIEKLYNQARAGKGAKKKGGGSRSEKFKAQKKGPRLDARMRKDRRGTEAAAKRNKGKGRGGGGGAKGKGGAGAGGVKAGKAGKNRRR